MDAHEFSELEKVEATDDTSEASTSRPASGKTALPLLHHQSAVACRHALECFVAGRLHCSQSRITYCTLSIYGHRESRVVSTVVASLQTAGICCKKACIREDELLFSRDIAGVVHCLSQD